MYKSGLTIWYNVKSMDESVKYFTEGLGFSLDFKDEEQRIAMITTNTKDYCIGFAEAETIAPVTSSAVFEVEDIEKTYVELKERGIQFTGEIETIPNLVKLATFQDPDGNSFELSQTLTD
ncbi:lactoylglutathione lyase [Gracilibacillus salitolerans]|uniref:Lactoylglutathione lyase n=1 Tax=Gracilibacillus salitolerans TaxID=2663022 RepID=A0A5Q2TNY0_9BACI|nr:VOC family protein [Gracilibacillus salitolerans]QGH35560.1 lactoylglutathione lyase [Gracilibacillus salitolerans]